jgi:hypothetical protein
MMGIVDRFYRFMRCNGADGSPINVVVKPCIEHPAFFLTGLML